MSTKDHPDKDALIALFQKGCEHHENGRTKEAQSIYLELLTVMDSPLVNYNLGLLYFDLEEYDDAIQSFNSALKHVPDEPDTMFNLALCFNKKGMVQDAADLYTKILETANDHIDAMYNLAGCLRELHKNKEAIEWYRNVLQRDPDHISALNNIAYTLQVEGNKDEAIKYYSKLLEIQPDHESAQHMLASLTGELVESSPDSYVRSVFDNFSTHYEESLVSNLKYSVPEQLVQLLKKCSTLPAKFDSGIDLGCGTGLSGEKFTAICNKLDGVDLSSKMVEIAENKKIYNKLFVDNIINFTKTINISYDLVVAADVFNYIGNLQELFEELTQKSKHGTVFCFSTEAAECDRFTLNETGRFAHSTPYISSLAEKYCWQVIQKTTTQLRKERDEWVNGNLWILRLKKQESLKES